MPKPIFNNHRPAPNTLQEPPTRGQRNLDIFGVRRILRSRLTWVFALYLAFFALFFWNIHGGVGQYWDWSFPYFSDHLDTLFTNKSSAWTNANMGSPLGYASDYFLRFLVSMFSFLPPEAVRYGFLVVVFAAGALGMHMLARHHTSGWLAFMFGLVAFVNPAMFYKYTAGHFNYIVSLALFVYLLYFLFYKFKPDLRSAVIVGLFFGLLGFQIQFFVITAIFLLVYFAFNQGQLRLKYLAIILILPVLLNLVWLSNFLVGATSAAETGAQAAKATFKALSGSDFLSIFTFSFAKATLLSKFYAFYELLWNAALFIFLLWLLVREKQKQAFDIILLIFLSVMIFMATGLYQVLPLGPLTMLYPMLREVGHFAPVIVLVSLILIARLVQRSTWRWALLFVLAGSLLMVAVKFQYFSQSYSYAAVRNKFASFKEFADADSSDYRVLAYPFFDQYSFKDMPKSPPGTLPLKNSGHDSFASFSPQDYITNTVAPHNFQESLQYKLLQTHDIDILRPYNVKYIFDFSQIYESNYERYVPPTVYNNDLSIIKNDKHFFTKLIAANPGKLRRVNDRILEIRDYKPRVSSDATMFTLADDGLAADASVFSRQALEEPLDYVGDDRRLSPYTTKLTPLYGEPTRMHADHKNAVFSQTLKPAGKGDSYLYVNRLHDTAYYEASSTRLTVFTQPTGTLELNRQPLYGDTGRRVLAEIPLQAGVIYYIAFKEEITAIKPGQTQRIGVATRDDVIDIFTSTNQNLVTNPSFENGLWQQKVNDCNNYEFEHSADIGMKQSDVTASEGRHSLELSASKHDACTYSNIKLRGDSNYLLRYDYQSDSAQTASFYLGHDKEGAAIAKGSQTILGDEWETYSTLIRTPEDEGQANLYFYAREQFGRETINRYDNVSFVRLDSLHRVRIPGLVNQYEKISLPKAPSLDFVIKNTGQTFRNLVPNPSFEEGPWQKNVSDCRNYDNKRSIAMRLNTADKTHGKQALELETVRHDACVRITTDVTANTEYQLAFDYKGQRGKYYGYAVSYDDPEHTLRRQQLEIKAGNTWQRATIRVKAPARATTVTLYLYAFETGDKSKNTILYDNVNLTELPDFSGRFYVVQQPAEQIHPPSEVRFTRSHPAQRNIQVTRATTPFFVLLSETYHPAWQLQLADRRTAGLPGRWLPVGNEPSADSHFKASGKGNGWLVDPKTLCRDGGAVRAGCTKNSDGSYDIQFAAIFAPQRWFTLAALASWLTIISCLAYLSLTRRREVPTYQSLRLRLLQQRRRR